jgi:hypothetical protein
MIIVLIKAKLELENQLKTKKNLLIRDKFLGSDKKFKYLFFFFIVIIHF